MFLGEPPPSPGQDKAYAADRAEQGYVDNLTRIWAWRPDFMEAFVDLQTLLRQSWTLRDDDRAVLVAATARSRGDSYCSLAWGARLARLAGDDTARAVLSDAFDELDARPQALARWAMDVVADPNAITTTDVDRLRDVGLSDREIFEATAFVALRLAFSTVNDALGAEPDRQLAVAAPEVVRNAVTYGRPVAIDPST